jgi:hypothetical protein
VSRLGAALFVALLAASVVVAGVVVHARSPDLALEVTHMPPRFSPNGDGRRDVERIRFFVRDSDPHATVEIVGPNLRPVRTLYTGPIEADHPMTLIWNGRTESGRLADPRLHFRLRVLLPDPDRDMVFPRRVALRRVSDR